MKKILIASIVSVVVGISLGIINYKLSSSYLYINDHESFLYTLMIASILIPLIVASNVSSIHKKTFKENFKTVIRYFIASIAFIILSLMLAAILSTKLYCTYGACSEFAGLEIIMVLIWVPIVVAIDAFVISIIMTISYFLSKRSTSK